MATTAESITASAAEPILPNSNEEVDLKLHNRLSESKSPYVRDHATNPVAWQMWNEETLALAKKSQRLIFLSIGYSACHWCHVMNRESFTDPTIASLLNKHFVPVKLDREERPDIDRIYMNYVQATTGGGGWPLNVFLTPDLEPLFGGTYWPGPGSTIRGRNGGAAEVGDEGAGVTAAGTSGFGDILAKLADVWLNQRARCVDSARLIGRQLEEFAREGMIGRDGGAEAGGGQAEGLDLEHVEEAFEHFRLKFDAVHGGFGGAPKFPTPVNLRFLIGLGAWGKREVRDVVGEAECKAARDMAVQTLRSVWRGGIKDQVGRGVARYSVTRDWSLPHFEKMLYDNALLLHAYVDAWLALGRDTDVGDVVGEMRDAVVDIAGYITSPPMRLPGGGICSSEDADSLARAGDAEKREGAFYVWTLKEVQALLGARDAPVVARYYGVGENGNVAPEHDAHDELIDQNVLSVKATVAELSRDFGLTIEEVQGVLVNAREVMRRHREESRPRPSLDDKVVVAFNGLAIGALARAGAAMLEADAQLGQSWIDAATKAASFIRQELWDANEDEGTLYRVWREGRGDVKAFADDYAFFISALIDLYAATWDEQWLEWADHLQRAQLRLFYDTTSPTPGGFFSTRVRESAPDLLLRLKDGMDNAEPSTNGISAQNLYRLSALLDDEEYAKQAAATVEAFEAEVMQHPFLFPSLLAGVVIGRLGMRSMQVVGDGADVGGIVRRLRGRLRPEEVVLRVGGETFKTEWLEKRNGLLKGLKREDGKVVVMVCEERRCRELSGEDLDAL